MGRWRSEPPVEEAQQVQVSDDTALVRTIQSDPSAFHLLFNFYWEPVHRYCYYRIGSWPEAEDIAQGVMITVSREIGGFTFQRGPGSFRSWLFTIAHNACIDGARRQQRNRTVALPESEGRIPHNLPPDDEVVMETTHGWIRSLMKQLPSDQAEVMHLRLAELTTAEIARVLGKSDRSVAKLTERARPRLRKLMDEAAGGRYE